MSEKTKIETILPETIIDIKISGAFYRRLSDALIGLCETVSPEELKVILEKLKTTDPPANPVEASIHAMLPIIHAIETNAKEQNKITIKEVDLTVPEETD